MIHNWFLPNGQETDPIGIRICNFDNYLKVDCHKGEEGSEGTEEAKVEGLVHSHSLEVNCHEGEERTEKA